MKPTHPLELLFAFGVLGALAAVVAGKLPLAVLLGVAALGALWRRSASRSTRSHRRPTITYLPAPMAHEPLVRLQRGQFISVPWPHSLQVLLPEGTRLHILETTPERIRVMAL